MQKQLPYQKLDKIIGLGEVERRLSRVMGAPPTRPTLIAYIDCGWLVGFQNKFNKRYFVYESSLDEYIYQTIPSKEKIAA